MRYAEQIDGFEWDEGNLDKNWLLHQVLNTEAEQIFFNEPLIIKEDTRHSSKSEIRFHGLGSTDNGRCLFVVFTLRENKIRIISARDMSRKERTMYHEKA